MSEELKPGRELDALIAEKVFGIKIYPGKDYYYTGDEDGGIFPAPLLEYSTSIADAWEVVEKLKQKEPIIQYDAELNCWHAGFKDRPDHYFMELSKDSAPHAICLVALKACEVE